MGAEEDKRNEAVVEESRTKAQPLTEAQFVSWKRHKREDRKLLEFERRGTNNVMALWDADVSARKSEAARKRAEDIAAGRVQMNGRELFLHEPWVFDNDH